MTIVTMTQAHILPIAALEAVCFSDPWPEAAIESELKNPLSLWLVAEENGQVIGYVGSQSVLGEADIMNVAVDPDFRRRGVARSLLTHLQQALAQQQVHSLTLEVRASNVSAITLYETLGFVQVGRRPNYYYKPKEDALILRKEWSL